MTGDNSTEDDDPDDEFLILPPEETPAVTTEPARFEVFPQNWRAFQFFRRAGTQWRFNPAGHVSGLDYAAVESIFNSHQVPPRQRARLLSDICLIERGALQKLAEIRASNNA